MVGLEARVVGALRVRNLYGFSLFLLVFAVQLLFSWFLCGLRVKGFRVQVLFFAA